jgi:SRSO17 transposase
VKGLLVELASYHALYRSFFRAESQRSDSYHYLAGLLDPTIKRKSAENIALARVGSERVRALEYFLGESRWSDAPLLIEHRRQLGFALGDANGVIILDGSDCAKQGEHSVGVVRQWCGELGKTDNCQAGVYLGYSSVKGYSLLDRRLYMPEAWFSPDYAERRYQGRVPADLTFQTKNELAWAMIAELAQANTLPARWLTMDEAFGRDTHLLERIANETPYYYFAEVPKDTQVWTQEPATVLPAYPGRGRPPVRLRLVDGSPRPQTLAQIAAHLPASAWQLHARKEGTKGFIIADIALCRVVAVRDGLPGPHLWLVLRRSSSDPADLHYFLSNAPPELADDELIAVCALRWPIETIFEQAKQLLGLNEYQTRTWFGWHHHMSFVILAFGFLARCQLLLKPDSPALTLPQIVTLLKAILPKPDFDPQRALDLVRHQQERNARAQKSHYLSQKKRIIDKLIVTQ